MQTLYRTYFIILFAVLLSNPAIQADPVHDVLFTQLQDENMGIRIAALRALQLTLDPRLPEALFELLDDEGNSIRRLAARGIGSRYWQIPEERVPAFVETLKTNSRSDFHDERGMANRAIALLTETYNGPGMSSSANRRWVLYERYSLPCLIDKQSDTEELLGWQTEEYAHFYYHKDTEAEFTCWHPEKELVVLNVSLSRRVSTLWAWAHRKGLRKLDQDKVLITLGYQPEQILGPGGFNSDHVGWSGDAAVVECSFTIFSNPKEVEQGEDAEIEDIQANVLWELNTGEVVKAAYAPSR